MANVFKTEIRPIPTTYITVDGVTMPMDCLMEVLYGLKGSQRYFSELIDIDDRIEKILKRRGILQQSVQGGQYVKDWKAYNNFRKKVEATRNVPYIEEEKQFYINCRKHRYKRQRPTKVGKYLYAFHEHGDSPTNMIVVKVGKHLMTRMDIQSDNYNCHVKNMPIEGHWKKVRKFEGE